jgi:hypothetical protein
MSASFYITDVKPETVKGFRFVKAERIAAHRGGRLAAIASVRTAGDAPRAAL